MRLREMNIKARNIILIIFLYIGFLIITLPAEQAYSMVKSFSKEDNSVNSSLIMKGLTGTVWSGKATAAYISGQKIKSLSWDFHPWPLLLGRLQIGVDFRDGDSFARGNVARGFGGQLYLSDLEARLGLKNIAAVAKLPLDLQGYIGLNLQQLSIYNQNIVDAQGTIAWQSAAVNFPVKMTFGDLKATLSTDNDVINVDLVDGGGPLQAEGILTIKADNKYKFTGTFSSRDPSQSALDKNLRLLGRAGSDGKIKVNKSGSINDFTKLFL
ncbi:MAG: type II secretion system protein N [Gammaproteobacteria bacterium]|nr:type II secretion system protein N [Gammaproteobacteria bacterium]